MNAVQGIQISRLLFFPPESRRLVTRLFPDSGHWRFVAIVLLTSASYTLGSGASMGVAEATEYAMGMVDIGVSYDKYLFPRSCGRFS